MMFQTHVGPVDDDSSIAYLRPETAQGIFTNYKNVVDTIYPDLFFVMVKYSIHGDKRVDRGEIKSFDDLMKYIYSFNSIETVKISTGINEKSLDIPGRYFEYKPRDYARDYISNLLLHKVTYNH